MRNNTTDTAIFLPALPFNPRPFLSDLLDHIKDGGMIDDDKSRRILWCINAMSHGELANIDMHYEWVRLKDNYTRETGSDPISGWNPVVERGDCVRCSICGSASTKTNPVHIGRGMNHCRKCR